MLSLRPLHPELSPFSPVYLLITWFHSGRIMPASGAWGTVAALPFCWFIHGSLGWSGLFLFSMLLFMGAIWGIRSYAQSTDHPDPSEVVIDEVLGMALVGLIAPFSISSWIIGTFLFRIIDSTKPGPIGWCDRNIKGPPGIIIDDILAGILAGLIVWALSLMPALTWLAA